ncbi:hypothetical protein HAX54_040367 [Datura stramonium]|uniref:Uncharacterized protein n=1 Tax=Datura stramonium TaxID=4076 RepID=A0ABS8SKA7_DATST|nr:hypothetical protein [Datura stramonium]
MEVLDISLCENGSNKENIPPFCSAEKVTPDYLKVKFCTKKLKRNFRRPLRDITYLFDLPVQPGTIAFRRFQRPVSVCGKRKSADENVDSLQKHKSKILRRDFR